MNNEKEKVMQRNGNFVKDNFQVMRRVLIALKKAKRGEDLTLIGKRKIM